MLLGGAVNVQPRSSRKTQITEDRTSRCGGFDQNRAAAADQTQEETAGQ
jgi:hypothetical protein